jgi:Peptidase M50B-like
MRNWLIAAAGVSLAVSLTPWNHAILYPFILFTTWIHECSHALTIVAVGGTVKAITIQPDTSGLTESLVPAGRFARALVASAGYLGASVVGCFLLAATRRPKWSRRILWAVGLFMIVTLVVWIRNVFGAVVVLAWAAALIAMGEHGGRNASTFVLSLLAIQVAFASLYDIRALFLLRGGHSDAQTMSTLFVLPPWVWATLWMLTSAGLLAATLWATRPRGRLA